MTDRGQRVRAGQEKSGKTICVHCGDPCDRDAVSDGDLHFCCTGCQAVYGLLRQSGMSTYYELEDGPGLKPAVAVDADQYAYLDKNSIRERLLDFDDGDTGRITFGIPQIHCSSCIWLLEHLFKIEPGVRSSRVDFARRQASIVFDTQRLSLSRLVALLASLGYEPDLKLSDLDAKRPDRSFRSLYAQVSVAGFCFGNVMLLSFPHYLGLEAVGELFDGRLFDYLKMLLTLPVVFYSARDFYASAWQGLRHRQINMDVPISLGIAVLAGRSFHGMLLEGTAGYLDSLCALVFLLLLGRLFQKKTYVSIAFDRDYRAYLPVAVARRTESGEESVSIEDVAVGDRLVIRGHELIPADAHLIAGDARIDYSFVTGESQPVEVSAGDRLFAGGRQLGGTLELEIVSEPSRSYLFRLWEEMESTDVRRSGVTTLANRVSQYFTPAVLGLAGLTALYWWWQNPELIWHATTSVLIVACPCALALSTPFALGAAQRLLGRAGIYLRDSAVIESMAALTTIVFDKTGTITRANTSDPEWVGTPLNDQQKDVVSALVGQSIHPLSVSLRRHLGSRTELSVQEFREELGQGLEAVVDGHRVRLGAAVWTGGPDTAEANSSQVGVSIDGDWLGFYRLAGHYRPGLPGLLTKLRRRFRLMLLSGDHEGERTRLVEYFGAESDLLFNQSPHDKLDKIAELARQGEVVGMIGDGLNDAGALKAARVGLAIAEDRSTFSPASDGVINSSSFELLPDMLLYARDAMRVIKASFVLSLAYNVVGLGFAVQGQLSPLVAAVLMPASSVTVVLFATLAASYYSRLRGLNS